MCCGVSWLIWMVELDVWWSQMCSGVSWMVQLDVWWSELDGEVRCVGE